MEFYWRWAKWPWLKWGNGDRVRHEARVCLGIAHRRWMLALIEVRHSPDGQS